jgi:hypothetical protein
MTCCFNYQFNLIVLVFLVPLVTIVGTFFSSQMSGNIMLLQRSIKSSPLAGRPHLQKSFSGQAEVQVREVWGRVVVVDFGRGNLIVQKVGESLSEESCGVAFEVGVVPHWPRVESCERCNGCR